MPIISAGALATFENLVVTITVDWVQLTGDNDFGIAISDGTSGIGGMQGDQPVNWSLDSPDNGQVLAGENFSPSGGLAYSSPQTYVISAADVVGNSTVEVTNFVGGVVLHTPLSPLDYGNGIDFLLVGDNNAERYGVKSVSIRVDADATNEPPIANAGPDQPAVECGGAKAGCAEVTLDGTGSSDPDGDDLTYTWEPGTLGGAIVNPILPLGTHVFTLTVDDGNGGTATDTVTVTVVDTAPPTISSATANPDTLWPPNHKMVDVTVTVDASDLCDGGNAACQITSVVSNEPDNGLGDGDTANDIVITGDLTVQLRAERSGQGTGRVYTINIECVDETGNASASSVTVTVPKSQGKKK